MKHNVFNLTIKAIKQLSPELRFTLAAAKDENNLTINAVDWNTFVVAEGCDGIYVPSQEEVETKFAELALIYDANEYQRLRASEYPSFADQFDLLYHGGYEAWKTAIDAVKAKYPKSTKE
jgi:hypothetical protein